MTFDLSEFAKDAAPIVSLLGLLGAGFISLILYRLKDRFVTRSEYQDEQQANRDRLDRHQQRLDSGERKFDGLNNRMDLVATKEDLHSLTVLFTKTNGQVERMAESVNTVSQGVQALANQVHLLLEHELRGDKS